MNVFVAMWALFVGYSGVRQIHIAATNTDSQLKAQFHDMNGTLDSMPKSAHAFASTIVIAACLMTIAMCITTATYEIGMPMKAVALAYIVCNSNLIIKELFGDHEHLINKMYLVLEGLLALTISVVTISVFALC